MTVPDRISPRRLAIRGLPSPVLALLPPVGVVLPPGRTVGVGVGVTPGLLLSFVKAAAAVTFFAITPAVPLEVTL